jgi:hypothetical protein
MPASSTYNSANVIAGSERDGWVLGHIGIPWPGPWPKKDGDLFVADPEGWQAGLAWESRGPEIKTICGPSEGRWGVFQVLFPLPVMSEQDLVRNFHLVLPLLKQERLKVIGAGAR